MLKSRRSLRAQRLEENVELLRGRKEAPEVIALRAYLESEIERIKDDLLSVTPEELKELQGEAKAHMKFKRRLERKAIPVKEE